jgi:hypothetical protein
MKQMIPEICPDDIKRELDTLRKQYREISKHEGKFVLIHGDFVAGYFDTYGEAESFGYEEYQLESFLIRKVTTKETPLSVMRCGSIRMDPTLRITQVH